MRFFGRRSRELRELESELRDNRPEPRDEFVDKMVGGVPKAPVPTRSRPRLGLALAFALASVIAFGAFGGIGYAKSAATNAADSTKNAVASVVQSDSGKTAARVRRATRVSKARRARYDLSRPARQSRQSPDDQRLDVGRSDPPRPRRLPRGVRSGIEPRRRPVQGEGDHLPPSARYGQAGDDQRLAFGRACPPCPWRHAWPLSGRCLEGKTRSSGGLLEHAPRQPAHEAPAVVWLHERVPH